MSDNTVKIRSDADDKSKAARFLDAFNRIETALRARARETSRRAGFSELVRESRDLEQRQKRRLFDMADLRNAIVHTPFDPANEIYADPRESAVIWMEEQADIIEKPPRVVTVLKLAPPKVLEADDEIDVFFSEATEPRNFSQSPFRRGDGKYGLITTNAVARWIAAEYTPNSGLLIESSLVSEVAKFGEQQDRVVLKPKSLKAVEAINIFSGADDVAPVAILITETGKHTENPLGLCVRADVPLLFKALGV